MSPGERTRLDDTDLAILDLLQRDARISNAEIGRRIDLAASAVFQRLKRLTERRVIHGHETRVDPRAVGLGLAAFILVRVDERVGSHRTARHLADLEEVQELHHVAGEDCYLLKVRVADTEALGRLLRDRVGAIEAVHSTRSIVVLETLKETGTLALPPGSSPD